MSPSRFLNSRTDIDWVREKMEDTFGDVVNVVRFQSFVLHGNEDDPSYIAFYAAKRPIISDDVVAEYWNQDDAEKFISDKYNLYEVANGNEDEDDDEDDDKDDYGADEEDDEDP